MPQALVGFTAVTGAYNLIGVIRPFGLDAVIDTGLNFPRLDAGLVAYAASNEVLPEVGLMIPGR